MSEHRHTVVVVGLDAADRRTVCEALARHGLEQYAVPATGLARQAPAPAAVVLDAEAGGLPALRRLRRLDPQVPVLIASSEAGTRAVLDLLRYGVSGVLRKPLVGSEVARTLGRVIDDRRVAAEVASVRSELRGGSPRQLVVAASPAMREAVELAERAADTDAPVLIEGPPGTGKNLLARVVHGLSARAAGPFVKVNCAGLPGTALESELFGYERGAFSGAVQHRPGKLDFAHHGTLFLDEVAALPPTLQARLLLALQEGGFSRVGGGARIPVDARVVAATSAPLDAAVAAGAFREDLYFRLKVVAIALPPLRERPEDIPALTAHFLRCFSAACNRPRPKVAESTLQLLADHDWPGNVRELQHAVRRLMLDGGEAEVRRELRRALAAGGRPARHPAESAGRPAPSMPKTPAPAGTLKEIARAAARTAERAAIAKVLRRTRWNRKAAAEFLGISYKALLSKIRENGLDEPATP